ncbi:MAG: hypothetical protein O7G85_00860 [Planctomycetota bacterium]|nr:hypothetical protein [Planctomycetota bacterium]
MGSQNFFASIGRHAPDEASRTLMLSLSLMMECFPIRFDPGQIQSMPLPGSLIRSLGFPLLLDLLLPLYLNLPFLLAMD